MAQEKFILAGVGTVKLIDPSTGELIVTSKTLTDSGINFALTAEDIRGGMANALLGQYFHDSSMGLTLTDSLFSMEYLALNVGGSISQSADIFTNETITTTVGGQITVGSTPKAFSSNLGAIGWYTIAGRDDWKKISFDVDTKTAEVEGLEARTQVCVQYIKEDGSAKQFVVSSAFIPSQCYALLTLPLFKAGTENVTSYTSSSKVGEVQVAIPNFILAGAQDLSLTSSGASTTALSGSALVTYDGSEGCDGDGYYAKLVQITYNKDEFADVKAIVVADSNIEIKTTETQKLEIYALYGGITVPRLLDNSKLTFTCEEPNISVDANGVVSATSTATGTIECVVTGHSDLVATAYVEVTN